MKIRTDFVTNSSSSSFIITNKTDTDLTLKDFALESESLFNAFISEGWYKDNTYEEFIEDAERRNTIIKAKESIKYECGDHLDDGLLEVVIHHQCGCWFRDNYESDRFRIKFHESHH